MKSFNKKLLYYSLGAILLITPACASKLKMMKHCQDTQIENIWLCKKY